MEQQRLGGVGAAAGAAARVCALVAKGLDVRQTGTLPVFDPMSLHAAKQIFPQTAPSGHDGSDYGFDSLVYGDSVEVLVNELTKGVGWVDAY